MVVAFIFMTLIPDFVKISQFQYLKEGFIHKLAQTAL
jgi:hypothetical protein